MKIYDCFIFHNEVELLELRLNILNDVVDKFVIVEGDTTFSGVKKESNFLKNKEKFKQWEDKIIYEFVEIPDYNVSWDREIFSRNYFLKLPIFKNEDVLISSDLDEIPNPDAIEQVEDWMESDTHFTFRMNFYMYYLNSFKTSEWFGSRAATYGYLKDKTVDDLREDTEDENKITGPIIEGGGWHFSYLGGEEMIREKIESFSHVEYNNDYTKSKIAANLEKNVDPFGRPYQPYKVVKMEEDEYPEYLINNIEKYSHLIKDVSN